MSEKQQRQLIDEFEAEDRRRIIFPHQIGQEGIEEVLTYITNNGFEKKDPFLLQANYQGFVTVGRQEGVPEGVKPLEIYVSRLSGILREHDGTESVPFSCEIENTDDMLPTRKTRYQGITFELDGKDNERKWRIVDETRRRVETYFEGQRLDTKY